jgi:hypothetical protein
MHRATPQDIDGIVPDALFFPVSPFAVHPRFSLPHLARLMAQFERDCVQKSKWHAGCAGLVVRSTA